jgi:ubiquinone/menaquinone biosynthesis C-methylase UbiE
MSEDIKRTQATFSYEWKMFRFGERNWGQDISFRKQLFLRGMGVDPSDMRGKLIFDAGCGSGALSIEMAKSLGMEVVALDLAFGIENAYRHNDSPYLHFLQGSVLEPPLRTGVFDYLYCAGVLVACPDARAGFNAVIRTLKRAGRCFTWWYHPINPTYYPTAWRKMTVYTWIREHITARLPIRLQYYLYLSLMPLFLVKQSMERLLGRRPNIRTWREKMQALFDFFSPLYFHRYEPPEIVAWYHEAGFSNAEVAYREFEGFAVRGDLA